MSSKSFDTALDALMFEHQPDLQAVNPNGALYFGTGLKSYKNGLTYGLPFEYLSMFCTAAGLAARYGITKVLQEITDVYEDGRTDFAANAELKRQQAYLATFTRMLRPQFSFSAFSASELRAKPNFTDVLSFVKGQAEETEAACNCPPYVLLQTAGLEFLRQTQDISLKLGWAASTTKPVEGMDERFFNGLYREITENREVSFAYIKCGTDLKGNRAVPYFARDAQERLLIAPDYDADAFKKLLPAKTGVKLTPEEKMGGNYYRNIEKIVTLFEALIDAKVFEPRIVYPAEQPLEQRVAFIIQDIFGARTGVFNQPSLLATPLRYAVG